MTVTRGVCIAILLNLSLAVLNLVTKMLVEVGYSSIQIMVVSSWFALIPLLSYKCHVGRLIIISKSLNFNLLIHLILSMSEAVLIFYAFGNGNLAEISIILSVCPLVTAFFSHFLLGEKMMKAEFILVFVSIIGVALIVKPTGDISGNLPMMAGVLGAAIYALSQVWVRKIRDEVSSFAVLFSTYMGLAFLGTLFIAGDFQPLQQEHWHLFLLLGICDILGICLLYFVLRKVSANVISPFQYTRILWGLFFGYIFFGDIIDIWSTIGLVVIILAGVKFVRLHVRKERMFRKERLFCPDIEQI